MLPDKSVLFEQINTILKTSSEKSSECDVHSISEFDESSNTYIAYPGNHFSYIRSIESIKKLEQRIVALEDQNDHMLYFIHYLYKNFTDLVKDILSDKNNNIGNENGWEEKNPEADKCECKNPCLTRREKEILGLLVRGLCAKEIASTLFISETTVITHKKNLKKKFNAKNSVELISKAFMTLFRCGK